MQQAPERPETQSHHPFPSQEIFPSIIHDGELCDPLTLKMVKRKRDDEYQNFQE